MIKGTTLTSMTRDHTCEIQFQRKNFPIPSKFYQESALTYRSEWRRENHIWQVCSAIIIAMVSFAKVTTAFRPVVYRRCKCMTLLNSSIVGPRERGIFRGISVGNSREDKAIRYDVDRTTQRQDQANSVIHKPWIKQDPLGSALQSQTVKETTPAILKESELDVDWFRVRVPEGLCIGITLNDNQVDSGTKNKTRGITSTFSADIIANPLHWARKILHPREVAHARSIQSDATRNTFVLGRLAMREGLCESVVKRSISSESHDDGKYVPYLICSKNQLILPLAKPILKDEHGRPDIPDGFIGSISHKQSTGIALVAKHDIKAGPRTSIGIDIERCDRGSSRIAKRILTPLERSELGQLEVSNRFGSN